MVRKSILPKIPLVFPVICFFTVIIFLYFDTSNAINIIMLYFSLLKSHFKKTLKAEFPSLLLSLLLSLSLTHTGTHRDIYTYTTDIQDKVRLDLLLPFVIVHIDSMHTFL